MAFKEIKSLDADTTVAIGGFNKKLKKDNPTSVEGYYLGRRQVDSPKSKSGKAWIYILQTPKGNLGVWGKTDMDKKMAQATPGQMIRITHTGMVPTPNGEMYKFSVQNDPDNTIEVDTALSAEPSNDGGDEEETGSEPEAYSSSEADDEEELQNQQLAALERKAKVQALLAGKGKTASKV